ncbi:MAG TPA: tRNA preQ1(34) S-adenosylmethionine ribosyltransferase-isomerase QueA [Candidatus Limnocylindrales bacterium]|nr:tRNA preQ1(34) S-adenosylmethionine ribosyltransferase-isomerase QueA [Candidatus Limnocylindrales bacterium]
MKLNGGYELSESKLRTELFNYHLPWELIAQQPVEPRDCSRLLVLDRGNQRVSETIFDTVGNWLEAGDTLVINDTKVIKARLFGKKSTGGRVEIFLLHPLGDTLWEAMLKPYPKGGVVFLGDDLEVKVLEMTEQGTFVLRFPSPDAAVEAMEKWGGIPLPPYIKEPLTDPDRYQTILAREHGSTAAPTAALHFTPALLQAIRDKGVQVVNFTLHMGVGSFRPIKTEHVADHNLSSEFYHLPEETVLAVQQAKRRGNRVVACGTDAVRALESASITGELRPSSGWTNLFIMPDYQFKIVDRIITNLHLPCSSHMVLISAFASREFVMQAYAYAVREKFRFLSFGDATLIV